MEPLFLLGMMFVAFWFFLLRPQQKRERARQELIRSLRPGDEVVTNAGIHGAVVEVEDAVVWVEVAPEVELKISREAITAKLGGEEADADADDEDEDDGDEQEQEDE